MIYLIRGHAETLEIACCESEALAKRRYAAGWRQVSRDHYMAWWTYFDLMRIWEMKRAAKLRRRATLIERVVGEIY